jgi:phosphoserine phosphatase RsbU/P
MDVWGGTKAVDRMFSVPGLDIHIVSTPYRGDDDGGDIYYISMCGVGNIARIVVADVSGHGEAVAETSGRLRKLMRKFINTPDQAQFARSLNEAFLSDAQSENFATALLATYWAPTDHLILVNAGHPPPLLYRRREDRWHALDSDAPDVVATEPDEVGLRNLPLGIIEPTGYDQVAVKLEKDDIVILYTDALPEASDKSGNQLGTEGLLALCEKSGGCDPDDLGPRLLEQVQAHRGGREPEDDQTMIVLHHNGADPKAPGLSDYARMLGRMMGVIGPSVSDQS